MPKAFPEKYGREETLSDYCELQFDAVSKSLQSAGQKLGDCLRTEALSLERQRKSKARKVFS
jgi:hypothetical protein